jgi:YidC/Oxa1 family membrane protein insertase
MELEDLDEEASAITDDAVWKIERLSQRAVRLSFDGDGIRVDRKLEAGTGPYQLWITTTVANRRDRSRKLAYGVSTHHYVDRKSESSSIPLLAVPSAEVSKGLCLHAPPAGAADTGSRGDADVVRREHDRKDPAPPQILKGSITFAGVENVYFLNAVAPHSETGAKGAAWCRMESSNRGRDADGEPLGTLYSTRLRYPALTLAPGAAHTYRELAYLGPKMPDDLAKAGHGFPEAIDFGFFAILSEALSWLLRAIHRGVGNWGVAIILLTLLVKLILYPLTAKSFQSMAKMRMLKPEMDRINELYKDDREKKGAATMELWRKHKINPMKGCLPQLLQLPIWIALYTSLRTNVELYHAPFALWWTDLSSPDPFYVLPLALGALMFLQQKMTPMATTDPVQAKMMMYGMPIMITSFMLFLPAGLSLYILTNSALSIGQQRLIEYRLKQAETGSPPASEAGPATEAAPPETQPKEDSAVSSAKPVSRIKKSKSGKSQRRSRSGRKKKTA